MTTQLETALNAGRGEGEQYGSLTQFRRAHQEVQVKGWLLPCGVCVLFWGQGFHAWQSSASSISSHLSPFDFTDSTWRPPEALSESAQSHFGLPETWPRHHNASAAPRHQPHESQIPSWYSWGKGSFGRGWAEPYMAVGMEVLDFASLTWANQHWQKYIITLLPYDWSAGTQVLIRDRACQCNEKMYFEYVFLSAILVADRYLPSSQPSLL